MATFTFTNSSGLVFADNGTVQQSLNVYGAYIGIATSFSLSLNGLSHARVSDLDMLLVAPDGEGNLAFWSDVGSDGSIVGADFRISDDAAASLPTSGALQGGTFSPADGGELETGSSFGGYSSNINHAQPNGSATMLSSFQFREVNGTWTLRVTDDARYRTGDLESWSLTITTNNDYSSIVGTDGNDVFSFAATGSGSGAYSLNDQGSVSYSGVAFFGLDGQGGNDLINGSMQGDNIRGGSGRDEIHGGLGDDGIILNAGDDVAGEIYDGGSDYDFIAFAERGGNPTSYDLRDDTLISLEELYFGGGVRSTVKLNASQFGAGIAVNVSIDGSSDSPANSIEVYMGVQRELDLSGIMFVYNAIKLDQFTVIGDADGETITGTAGADILDGGAGIDTMTGGTGNDRHYVDTARDVVIEAAGGGSDYVLASASYTLRAGVEVERLSTTNSKLSAAITLSGNEFGQRIDGNEAGNKLSGVGGNDQLFGYGGNDALYGGEGKDTLTGGIGNDNFLFDTKLSASNIDVISDFANASGNNDTVRLENAVFTVLAATGTLGAGLFKANATGTASEADDRILYETDTGKLFYDADGNKAGGVAGVQFATISNYASIQGAALSAADFLVV